MTKFYTKWMYLDVNFLKYCKMMWINSDGFNFSQILNERVTCTFIILLRIKDWRKTHTSRTSRFCMYRSLIVSQVVIQFEMYRWMNSLGKSTVVVNLKVFFCSEMITRHSTKFWVMIYLLTTSIECRDISMFTNTLKYSVMCLHCINFNKTSIAINGLFSTNSGN